LPGTRYVRLFLRKTACWHRVDRLGYHDDISDIKATIDNLQRQHTLPRSFNCPQETPVLEVENEDICDRDVFTFADASIEHITSIEEAVTLLNLEELKTLAKESRVQGRNKSELMSALCRMSYQQTSLLLETKAEKDQNQHGSIDSSTSMSSGLPVSLTRQNSNQTKYLIGKILETTGPCIRISSATFRLFERVHLVFYRTTEWTEKSLTAVILAKMSKRNFPDYIVSRTTNIFTSRSQLREFEQAIKAEAEVDRILETGSKPTDSGVEEILKIFERVYPRWKIIVNEEQEKEEKIYEPGEGPYLRRFTAAYSYTRIIHKACSILGRLKDYAKEHSILTDLLSQRLFHISRRGIWYQRKALLEEHYMHTIDSTGGPTTTIEQLKKRWIQQALATCDAGLQDSTCHLIYHYDLQKRLGKLEKQLRIPRRLQHDFSHVRLHEAIRHTVKGIRLVNKNDNKINKGPGKTIWIDELEEGGECSVEEMCLSWYRSQGWKGYHSEGGIIRTLFAYLFFDILYLYMPNVFQTAYQTCPLDLHTDAFYIARTSEINRRLVEIANGEAERIIRTVDGRERKKRTCIIGLKWEFELDDLVELVQCFDGDALATICKVMAEEYGQRGGGIPDLILWRVTPKKECLFAEVKSENDRLSDTQRLWIHVLTSASVNVATCHAIAKEVREKE
jgi:fanconi-associated nuclease 1